METKATKNDIGKQLIFKALTRWNSKKASRKIKDVKPDGSCIVWFGGWDCFKVKPHEIIEIK